MAGELLNGSIECKWSFYPRKNCCSQTQCLEYETLLASLQRYVEGKEHPLFTLSFQCYTFLVKTSALLNHNLLNYTIALVLASGAVLRSMRLCDQKYTLTYFYLSENIFKHNSVFLNNIAHLTHFVPVEALNLILCIDYILKIFIISLNFFWKPFRPK